jgi:hypothetical protein
VYKLNFTPTNLGYKVEEKLHLGGTLREKSKTTENRLTDGGEFISLMRQSAFNHRKIAGTHFCYWLSPTQGRIAAGWIS